MAIEIVAKVHPSPAVPTVPGAYLMIERIDYARLIGTLSLRVIVFASREDRDRLGQALADIAKQAAIVGAGDPSVRMGIPAGGTAQEVLAAREARTLAAQAYRAAQESLAVSQAQIQEVRPIDVVGLPRVVNVPPVQVASCLTDGQPDVARCYEWLATQPGFGGLKA